MGEALGIGVFIFLIVVLIDLPVYFLGRVFKGLLDDVHVENVHRGRARQAARERAERSYL